MTGERIYDQGAENQTLNVTHGMFANAAATKLMLPPSDTNAAYAIGNALVAIYGVLAEIAARLTPAPGSEVEQR